MIGWELKFVFAAFASLGLTWLAANAALAVVALRRRAYGRPGAALAAAGGVAGFAAPGLLAAFFACQALRVFPEWMNDAAVPIAVGAVWAISAWCVAAGVRRARGGATGRTVGWGLAAAAVAAFPSVVGVAAAGDETRAELALLVGVPLQAAAAALLLATAGGRRAIAGGLCGTYGAGGVGAICLSQMYLEPSPFDDLNEREGMLLLGSFFAALAAQPVFATLAARRAWDAGDEPADPPRDPGAS